jgi:hypothetical protein
MLAIRVLGLRSARRAVGRRALTTSGDGSVAARYEGSSVPGHGLPPLETHPNEVHTVKVQYAIILSNLFMLAFLTAWYMKKVAWTKDPGESAIRSGHSLDWLFAEDLSSMVRPLITRASSDPAYDPVERV